MTKDIDGRKLAEAQLRASEERYRALVELHGDAVCRWLPDTTLTYTNACYRELFGLTEGEDIGRRWLDFVPEPERDQVQTFCFALAQRPRQVTHVHSAIIADGSSRWTAWADAPLFDEQGRLVEFQSVGRDVTEHKLAEAALRDSERRYRELFDANPHPMWVYDLQTLRFLAVNDAAVAHYGWSRDEFLAMTIAEIRPPEDVPRLLGNVAAVIDGRVDRAGIWRHRLRDGSLIEVEISSHVIDAGGRRAELVLANDVTEKRRAERELQRTNRVLQTLTECNLVLVRAADEAQMLNELCGLIVGHGGYRMCWIGMAEEDAARSVRPVAVAGVDQGYFESVRISWADDEFGRGPTGTAIRERRPVVACRIEDNPRFVPWREAARSRGYASSVALPLCDEDGRCFGALNIYAAEIEAFGAGEVGFLGRLADDTAYGLRALRDRKARTDAEAQLRSSVQRLQHLMQTSPAILYSLRTVDGRLELCEVSENVERILGYTRAEALSPGWWFENLHPDDRAAVPGPDRLLALEQDAIEYRFRHKDGRYLWMRDGVRVIRDAAGAALEVVGGLFDISERRESERALRELTQTLEHRVSARTAELTVATERAQQANQAKSEFLSRMSHELRTPLNAVIGFAQILELSNPNERQRIWAQEIRRAGAHLLELIEQLLDLSRIEVGRLPLQIRAQLIAPIVNEAIGMTKPLIEARGIELQVLGLGGSVAALVDGTRLRQILVNYLSNAVKFSRSHGGRITVTCSTTPDGRLRLAVTDNGAGIAPEKLGLLFQPFERLGAEGRGVAGTGIGLALSKQLAELMDGRVGAESVPGEGSSFWVEVPQATVAPVHAAAVPAKMPLTTQPVSLLYVDDDPINIEVMRAMLVPYPNLELITTNDGAEAIEIASRRQPGLVLLDIHMPNMDGFTVLSSLRNDPRTRAIPVAALTADAMPAEVERGLAAGFARYLTKPVLLESLLEVVAELAAPGQGEPA